MHYIIVSFSHKNTDINTREKLAFNCQTTTEEFLKELVDHKNINEAIALSTCNRVEIILSVSNVIASSEHLFEKLSLHSKLSIEELKGRAEVYEDNGAIHHLFCVCSSLDSLVVGETQISGQLKNAFKFSYERGFCSQKLSRAMHFAFKCAAEIRNSTDISKNPVSVASVAVSKAKDILGNLGGETAIVVGAGEMSILATRHLVSNGCNVLLVNRDLDRAKEIADNKDLRGMVDIEPFSKLKEIINRHKLLFCATGAPHTIITKDMIEKKSFKRYFFDIAMPRDVDNLDDEDVIVFAVDDLEDILNSNLSLREEQAKEAFSIIGRYTIEFYRWLSTLSVDPIIKEMRDQARQCSMKELEKAIYKGHLDEDHREIVKKILHNTFNQFLHEPTKKLKDIQYEPQADMIVEAVKMLFGINKEVKMINKYKCEEHIQRDAQ